MCKYELPVHEYSTLQKKLLQKWARRDFLVVVSGGSTQALGKQGVKRSGRERNEVHSTFGYHQTSINV